MARTPGIDPEFAFVHVLPVEQVVGKQTLQIIRTPLMGCASILRRPSRPGPLGPLDYERLTPLRTLSELQLSELREILNDQRSYWNGGPIYRRFPPRPGFAFQLTGANGRLDLLVDLHNPGWEWFCETEHYRGFNFAGPGLTRLAKAIFPEYASKLSRAVWKKDAIIELEEITA